MACYFITQRGDNKVLDIGDSISYSMHGNTKVSHVYHPIINCHVSGFCWWDTPEYEVHCVDDLSYWEVLEKYKIKEDRDIERNDFLQYYDNIKNANLKYSEVIGVYI